MKNILSINCTKLQVEKILNTKAIVSNSGMHTSEKLDMVNPAMVAWEEDDVQVSSS